jgi:hypothetical protein
VTVLVYFLLGIACGVTVMVVLFAANELDRYEDRLMRRWRRLHAPRQRREVLAETTNEPRAGTGTWSTLGSDPNRRLVQEDQEDPRGRPEQPPPYLRIVR